MQRALIAALCLLCGFGAGFCVHKRLTPPQIQDNTSIERQSGYQFINPLLDCEASGVSIETLITPFRSDIKSLVEQEKSNGTITDAAVYFRDLNNGPWFGINEWESYLPASLLKLPLMLNFYKLSESRPSLLALQIPFEKKYDLDISQLYPPEQTIEPGRSYSIEELIRAAIIYSDNQAAELLRQEVPKALKQAGYLNDPVNGLNSDLSYLDSILGKNADHLSVREYGTFLRVLYNASFLERARSEHALDLLHQSTFRRGLVAGVPPDVRVAHKFGESGTPGQFQLHDCGIIYHKIKPYILCVMTKGTDATKLPSVIERISAEVYKNVDVQTK
jgi:beta-lactamase class A